MRCADWKVCKHEVFGKAKGILFTEVPLFQGVLMKEVPLVYTLSLVLFAVINFSDFGIWIDLAIYVL